MGLRGVSASGGTTSRVEVLRAFGFEEGDLPAIRADGEHLLAKDSEEEPDGLLDCGFGGASQESEASDGGPAQPARTGFRPLAHLITSLEFSPVIRRLSRSSEVFRRFRHLEAVLGPGMRKPVP